jgi:hypothetical protein
MWKACVTGGRSLLFLIAIVISVMPWTEYFWHFDKFLHGGGQDFELSVLSIVTIFCLVVVLLQQGKTSLRVLLRVWRWSFGARQLPGFALTTFQGFRSIFRTDCLGSPTLTLYSLPIQV